VDPWDQLRRVAADRRSGASELAVRTADAVSLLRSERDVLRAARRLLRVHPAMAPLWRVFSIALEGGPRDLRRFRDRLAAEPDGVVRAAAGWAVGRRAAVLTHSASSSVARTLRAARKRITGVQCTVSLPGGEGRPFARRLEAEGFEVRVIADAEVGRACEDASVALVGADAVTEDGVVNKVGTLLVALAAREAGIPCYALAGTSKLLASSAWRPGAAPAYESTPLRLFDAVISERGAMSPGAVRRGASRVEIPRRLRALLR
jgi:translation initiation factor eIF-2B subunit delta